MYKREWNNPAEYQEIVCNQVLWARSNESARENMKHFILKVTFLSRKAVTQKWKAEKWLNKSLSRAVLHFLLCCRDLKTSMKGIIRACNAVLTSQAQHYSSIQCMPPSSQWSVSPILPFLDWATAAFPHRSLLSHLFSTLDSSMTFLTHSQFVIY